MSVRDEMFIGAVGVICAEGLREIEGDIPGRKVFFGSVEGNLPAIDVPKYNTRTNQLLLAAAHQIREPLKELVRKYGASRVAIILGSSNTGVDEVVRGAHNWRGCESVPAGTQFEHLALGNPSAFLSEYLGVTGPVYTISTACSASAKAMASARRLISRGVVDAAITGGADGRCRFALNGFHALGALSEGRCRPFAEDRDGINLGEGAALFTLERMTADNVGVTLAGVGETSDAYHATAPDPEGKGAEAAMRAALTDAELTPDDITYINLHGTGTLANDAMEMKAVKRVFGERKVFMASTKSRTGHCLGAAGAIEAAICYHRLMCGKSGDAALSNSFAFGGANAALVLRRM